jgi:hypothetical protein
MVGIRDRAGSRFRITRHPILTYDVTRITSPNGRWIDVTQDQPQKVTQVRDNLGRTVSYTYDDCSRLTFASLMAPRP